MSHLHAVLAGLVLAAAPAQDLSWLVDDEIPAYAAAAEQQAAGHDAGAAQTRKLHADVTARRAGYDAEKAKLAAELPNAGALERGGIEKRIAELSTLIANDTKRLEELRGEEERQKAAAAGQRAFAAAAKSELAARQADAKKNALVFESEEDLAGLPDARIKQAIAFHERRLARIPAQLAALEKRMDEATDMTGRGQAMARKGDVRGFAATEENMIAVLKEALQYRESAKADEDVLADQLEQTAKARAAERASEVEPPIAKATGPDEKDRFLDEMIAREDREAAAVEDRAKLQRTLLRAALSLLVIGGLVTVVVFLVRRS